MKHVSDLVKHLPPYEPCEQCRDSPGYVTVMRQWGTMQVPSQARCVCWSIHQAKVLEAIKAGAKQGKR